MPVVPVLDESLNIGRSYTESLGTPPEEQAGVIERIGRKFEGSLLGTLAFQTLPKFAESMVWSEREPGFDPWKDVNDQWFRDNPWMIEPYRDGTVNSIPNSYRFESFRDYQKRDYMNRQRIAGAGESLVGGFLTGGVAMLPDLIVGGAAGKAIGAGRALAAPGEWAAKGGYFARAAKTAAVLAPSNLAYEEAIRAANPNRNVDEIQQAIGAVEGALVFAVGIPLLGAGRNALGGGLNRAWITKAKREAAEEAAALGIKGTPGIAEAELESLRNAVKDGPPTERAPLADAVAARKSAFTAAEARLEGIDPAKKLNRGEVDAILDGTGYKTGNQGFPTAQEMRSYLSDLRDYGENTPDHAAVASSESGISTGNVPRSNVPRTGQPVEATAFRGGKPEGAVGGTFYTPDESLAKSYAGPGGTVTRADLSFKNPLVAKNWVEAKKALGITGTMEDLNRAAVAAGHDGIVFEAHNGQPEYVKLPASTDRGTVTGAAATEMPPRTGQTFTAKPAPSKTIPNSEGPVGMGAASPHIGHLGDDSPIPAAGGDTRQQFTFLRTDKTAKDIDALKAKWGDQAVFHEHPHQDLYDIMQDLDKLQEATLGGPIRDAVAKVLNPLVPAPRLFGAASPRARQAAHLLFDSSRITEERAGSPVTARATVPAEGIKMEYDGHRDLADRMIDESLRDGLTKGPITYTFADGTTGTVRSRAMGRHEFGRMVLDHLRQRDEFSRSRGDAPNAPPAIMKAADAYLAYTQKMGREALDVGLLKGEIGPNNFYLTREWLADKIRGNRVQLRQMLIDAQAENRVRTFQGNLPIEASERPLVEEVVNHGRKGRVEELGLDPAEREQIRLLAKGEGPDAAKTDAGVETLTEGNLPPELLKRYLEEVDIYHQTRADAMIADILDDTRPNGSGHAGGASVFKGKNVEIDETKFGEFLNDDLFGLLHGYHHKTAGRIAARQAIKADAAQWPEIDFAAKDSKGRNFDPYDPAHIIKAVSDDYQKWIDAAVKAGDKKTQDEFEVNRKRMLGDGGQGGLLRNMIDRLEGRPLFQNNTSASVFWNLGQFLGKQVLKATYTAFLGMQSVAQTTDMTSMFVHRNLGPERLGTMLESLNFLREVPVKRDLEGLYVAYSDIARTMRDVEVGDVAGRDARQPFGPGQIGKILTRFDAGTDVATSLFTKATGIRRVNVNLKRAAATMVMQDVLHGATLMAKADSLVAGGMSEADALAKVGMDVRDARRLNRLGINGDRAKRLVAMLDEHAVDREGNRVTSAHDGFIAPEMQAWATKDKDLFRALNYAVNSETLNTIIEPKLLSRPLMNNTIAGRMFNQFQTFAMAWGNQLAPLALEQSGFGMLRYAFLTVGAGALADAVYAQLSGRRSFDQSAKMWRDRPYGMIYAAVMRSALPGWLQRPLGTLEQMGVGLARLGGKQFDVGGLSTTYGRKDTNLGDLAGPSFGWMNNVYKTAIGSLTQPGYWNNTGSRQAWNAMPAHNLLQLRALMRIAEAMGYKTPRFAAPRPFKP